MDSMTDILTAIKDVGFPIGVTAFLLWERHVTLMEIKAALARLLETIEQIARRPV